MAWTAGYRRAEIVAKGAGASPLVLAAAAIAVAAELIVQRLLVRVGIHIPALPFLRGPYRVVTEAGSILFPAAAVLAVAALLVSLRAVTARLPSRAATLMVAGVLPFPVAGLLLGLGGVQAGWELRLAVLYLLAVAAIAAPLLAAMPAVGRAFAALLAFSLALGALAATPTVASFGRSADLAAVGEGGMLVAAGLAVAAFRPAPGASRRALILAATVGAALLAAELANRWTTNIVLLWGLGLTGTLPVLFYVAAAAALAYAAAGLIQGRRAPAAIGLLLVAMGGYGLHNTYQSTVQILGLCVLLAAQLEERRYGEPAVPDPSSTLDR